jgi:diacylglycerol kinase family enzyme
VAAVRPGLKKKIGQGAFWLAGFQQLFQYSFPELELTSNGNSYRGTFAVIARSRGYGGPLTLVPQADLFADRFDICLFEGRSRWRYFRYLVNALFGKHLQLPGVRCLTGRSVEIQGDPGTWIQIDGELLGHVPARFTILPDALSLVVPPDR